MHVNAVMFEKTFIYIAHGSKLRQRVKSLIRRRLREAASDLGLHSLSCHINAKAVVKG